MNSLKIAIAGGTGTVGRLVVAAAKAAGHETVVLSRTNGVDLMSGIGLADAIAGADSVIDVSGPSSQSTAESVRFFGDVTRNLLSAEQKAGVAHHVAISIIGAAAVDSNYYAGKALQERLLQERAGGWSMIRTAQFHEFAALLVQHGKVGPLQVVPTMRSQPVAAAEVADALLALATGEPQGLVPDLAGPRQELMADLVRRFLAATHQPRPVLQVPLPGAWGRALRNGTLLPSPDAQLGHQTFDDWLASQHL
ncbi:MAG: 3-beta hydroxysteroid dehydrogenase [Frondihabitans sp.]|nr:3-beta hydroxysteroid dehydrogenase [Frondihabitans sp.]